MKKFTFLLLLSIIYQVSFSQVSYIAITGHNSGSGTFNLFDHYVSVGQNCYVNWEVYSNGLTGGDACGTKTQSRLVLRRTGSSDSSSVIASAPIYVTGVCDGKNGNNDKYYANLGPAINKAGRYSLEIQADVLPAAGAVYDNNNTATTWNYACPPAYYLTGTSGPTGIYYPAPVSCPTIGLSDPVGGITVDKMNETNSNLKYFTVGEVGVYRAMIIINGSYFDFPNGKFQPGNPTLPQSLDGTNPFPGTGICAENRNAPPTVTLGAEINIFKRTDCSADVTGARTFYRIYKNGTTAPVYSFFNIGFKDDCSTGGPEGHIFPQGGSCNNVNNVLDQRWQTVSGAVDVLPSTFIIGDTGKWNFDCYIETYAKDCSGANITLTTEYSSSIFTVQDPNAPGANCSSLPIVLNNFNASKINRDILLQWQVASYNTTSKFIVERSLDGLRFTDIGSVTAVNNKINYSFTDLTYAEIKSDNVFYRLRGVNANFQNWYSRIIKVDKSDDRSVGIFALSTNSSVDIRITNLPKGNYSLSLISNDGKQIKNDRISVDQTVISSYNRQIEMHTAKGLYFLVLRNEYGELIAKRNFIR